MPIQIDLREFPEMYEKVMRGLAQAESRGQTEASLRVLKAKTLRDVFPR